MNQPMTDEQAEKHIGLVRSIASKFTNIPSHMEPCDIEGAGYVGMLWAWQTFDESLGVKFSTYASKAIWWAIKNAIDGDEVEIDHGQDVCELSDPDLDDDETETMIQAMNEAIETILTPRQRDIMRLIAAGKKRREIVDMLGVSLVNYDKTRQRAFERIRTCHGQ